MRFVVKKGDKYLGENAGYVDSLASAKKFDTRVEAVWSMPLADVFEADDWTIVCADCGAFPCVPLLWRR